MLMYFILIIFNSYIMKSINMHNTTYERAGCSTDALLDVLFCIFLGCAFQLAFMLHTSILDRFCGGCCVVRAGHLSWFRTAQDKTGEDELGNV